MSRTTNQINKITGAVIAISGRLIVYALVFLLLYQGVTKGYEFGHELFYATSVDQEPGRAVTVTIGEKDSLLEVANRLKENGLVENEYSLVIQSLFFDYEANPGVYTFTTAMTSKEMLQMMDENTGEEEKK